MQSSSKNSSREKNTDGKDDNDNERGGQKRFLNVTLDH